MSNLTNQHTQIASELPRLILLDRDGVINQDYKDYIKNAEEWAPIKGSLEAIGYWQRRGIEFAVCTNQSGLGRGLFSMAAATRAGSPFISSSLTILPPNIFYNNLI